jgi:hypothetical protein
MAKAGWPCSILCLLSAIVAFAPERSALAQPTITIHPDRFAGPALVGFGAQMNPYLYCRPNCNGPGDERGLRSLEEKVLALRPQHVRIFVLKQWFDGRADVISKGDPRTADSFFRVVKLAQSAGATVNLTYWYEPGWKQPEQQMDWFAGLVAEMHNRRGLTAAKYLTVQNEPNLHEDKISKDLYVRLYRALDAALKRAGVRDKVKIVGGDLVQDHQQAWFEMLGSKLSGVSDGYSIHAYWDFWDTPKILRRLELPRQIVDALPANQRRPLFVTEFGVRGRNKDFQTNDPGDYEDGSPIATQPIQAAELAQFVLQGLNRGYVAFVVWTMDDALYDHPMQYGVIGGAKDGWPLKPGYHVLRLLTHTIQPGWRAVAVEGSGDALVSAARGPKGELTVLALNTSDKSRDISVAGLPAGKPLNVVTWNGDGAGRLGFGGRVTPQAASHVMTLPPRALIVLTTVATQGLAP